MAVSRGNLEFDSAVSWVIHPVCERFPLQLAIHGRAWVRRFYDSARFCQGRNMCPIIDEIGMSADFGQTFVPSAKSCSSVTTSKPGPVWTTKYQRQWKALARDELPLITSSFQVPREIQPPKWCKTDTSEFYGRSGPLTNLLSSRRSWVSPRYTKYSEIEQGVYKDPVSYISEICCKHTKIQSSLYFFGPNYLLPLTGT